MTAFYSKIFFIINKISHLRKSFCQDFFLIPLADEEFWVGVAQPARTLQVYEVYPRRNNRRLTSTFCFP
jgi:hypothetical protein